MLETYLGALAVLVAAAAVGQAIFALCGRTKWSWLAPAVGLAALMPIAWWAVRLPTEGSAAVVVLGFVGVACAIGVLAGPVTGLRDAARVGLPIAAAAVLLASIPFIAEGRFGILGTGLNPDMSQHLFAADRLAHSGSERLISQGYPLGPHSLAVALNAVGVSLVHAFDAVTIATAVAAALAPLALLARLPIARRVTAALLVGFAYMTAAYLTQGAFKETLQAVFLLAFAIGLERLARGRLGRGPSCAVPLAVLAVGSVYVYSFPGLLWLGGAAGAWAAFELVMAAREGGRGQAFDRARGAIAPAAIAGGVFILAIAPEVGRMIDFASFETFDPGGAGLGNLFNPLSPLEALGIWPSGDFRLDPGDGAAPAIVYYAGGLAALAALAFGLWWWLRKGERAAPAALAAAALLIAYAHIGGTPYQEAKAIALTAPLAMLISIRALAEAAPTARQTEGILRRRGIARLFPHSARLARARLALAALAATFTLGAAGCSLIALANGPVGPSSYSPALAELRPLAGPTLVLLPSEVLADEHGRDYYVWELRGGRVCVADLSEAGGEAPPGIHNVLVVGGDAAAPFAGAISPYDVGPYTLWTIRDPTPGHSGCPFISDGERADPGGSDARD